MDGLFSCTVEPLKLSRYRCYYYICCYDKRTDPGFKGQANVPEEASLTSTRSLMH
jgi:hypothetical protein